MYKTKKCLKCGKRFPIKRFSFRNIKFKIRRNSCKDCDRIYTKRYYVENRERVLKNANARGYKLRKINRELSQKYKEEKGCFDCGNTDYRVLDYHHVKGKKNGNVSDMLCSGLSWKKITKEIKKCIVVCANCHRIRHFKKKNKK